MTHLDDVLRCHTTLRSSDIRHLQRLVAEWQLLADLSFADLLLWVRTGEDALLCVAQVRPTTGPTAYEEDQIGRRQPLDANFQLAVALRERRICREADPEWDGDLPIRREVIPVQRVGAVVGLLSRDTNLAAARSPSALELAYLQGSAELCQMIAEGRFPAGTEPAGPGDGPRVGDGLIRLDEHGVVSYASPNALSLYRRLGVLGDIRGRRLGPLTRRLATDPLDGDEVGARLHAVIDGDTPPRTELEANNATIVLRALPLRPGGEPHGALVLVHDVTDVRRRERELVSKDATIREIHHRVKNNLQTVAALLRLQARRVDSPEARTALSESVRRVSSIAFVHETLALSLDERVHFDEVLDQLAGMVGELADPESPVTVARDGGFGELPAQLATPLAMVLTELLQNAVEHAFVDMDAGTVVVAAVRTRDLLVVSVTDDGAGLPRGFDLRSSDRLGLQIVRTLVDSELRGTIELTDRQPHGTTVTLWIPLGE